MMSKPLDDYYRKPERETHYQNRDELVMMNMELKRKIAILQIRIDQLCDENVRLKIAKGEA